MLRLQTGRWTTRDSIKCVLNDRETKGQSETITIHVHARQVQLVSGSSDEFCQFYLISTPKFQTS